MKSKFRRFACAALSVTMAATITATSVLAVASNSGKSPLASERIETLEYSDITGKVDLSKVVRDNLSDKVVDEGGDIATKTVNAKKTVIVSLDTPSISQRTGEDTSVSEYLQTSEGRRALVEISDSQRAFFKKLSSAGIAYKEVARYSSVINAVAIEVNTTHFKKIKKFAGVSMAGVSKTYAQVKAVEPQLNDASVVYGTGIYDSTGYDYDGTGVTVAILDTGIDYTHEAFKKQPDHDKIGMTSDKVENALPELVATKRSALSGQTLTVEDVYLSDKIPFAYDYADDDADVYPSYSQHGVHVAGIVAGQADTYINKDGQVVNTKGDGVNDFSGVAPNAQLVVMKVFTDNLDSDDLGGATSEDIVAALDDCVTLGVDIINMSLGTTSGFSLLNEIPDGDEEDKMLNEVYKNIKKEGISLVSAAGNEYSSGYGSEFGTNLASNPDSGTVGSPSTFVGAMSVASINGQQSPYLLANPGENSTYGDTPIYYYESNNANSVPFNFLEGVLEGASSGRVKYVVIPGTGSAGDYSSSAIQSAFQNKGNEKVIAVVSRGTLSFKDKVEIAQRQGADGIIVYNNVAGMIRMSLGDIDDANRIPAISVSADAGAALTIDPSNPKRLRTTGYLELDEKYLAGPFMNDYSSWGATPDLKLKPDITAHGGEITSTVSGGYEEMSGTSMATPNLAGFMALVKEYLKNGNEKLTGPALTTRTNQIIMSSASLVYDQNGLPYSPRKQGAGLATLSHVFSTQAYLSTDEKNGGAEDDRPKIELGEDEEKNGEYTFEFTVHNFGTGTLSFNLVSRFMTETLALDGLAVAESAYMLDDNAAVFTVDGKSSNGSITVSAGSSAKIGVKLTLSKAEKDYLDDNFKNGMYVEGFISLVSQTDGQCDLNLPFMGFYGDWEAAPLLDYNCYEISAIQQDTSLNDDEKPHESVFATQLYSTYYNGKYAVPMGGFAYVQDENADQVYVDEEHCAVSRYNNYYGATATDNYMTSTGIRALYAGLLRNAELVTYDIYNAYTGEFIVQGEEYTIGKAYAAGGTATPALVDLKLSPDDLGLINNGKYRIEFNFYMYASYRNDPDYDNSANTFSTNFYVDYDAPVLTEARVRYYDYTENNKPKQRVYLDLDVYDNHYPQSVLLCYSDDVYVPGAEVGTDEINLATEYVTPIINPGRNTTTTVTIEITDIYEEYGDRFYVQLDDYALNHTVYPIDLTKANAVNQTSDFGFVLNNRVTRSQDVFGNYEYNLTIDVNEAYTVELNCGDANVSNFNWSTLRPDVLKVKNNVIFGVKPTTNPAVVIVEGGDGKTLTLNVTVVDSSRTLSLSSLSFGLIKNSGLSLQKASGTVEVNAGQTYYLEVKPDPWYYPVENLKFSWTSDDQSIATVEIDKDEPYKAKVTTKNERGTAVISAAMLQEDGSPSAVYRTSVTLYVQEPFTISSMVLTKYWGSDKIVRIPDDENVMYIGEEAFKDNDTMEVLYIPRTVTEISERAFRNCTALKEVYFIDKTDKPVDDLADINLILRDAFMGCTSLELLDLTNVKVVTVAESAFANCKSLKEITHMEKIGIAEAFAFAGTALEEIDISGLHTSGINVFAGCLSLEKVTTDHYTAMSAGMFYGCTSLKNIVIKNPRVAGSASFNSYGVTYGGGAFQNCTNLEKVYFIAEGDWENTVFRIDPYAFAGCKSLDTVEFNGNKVSYIGDFAFAGCEKLTSFTLPDGVTLGNDVFSGAGYTPNSSEVYADTAQTILLYAPSTLNGTYTVKDGVVKIAPYAFASTTFTGSNGKVVLPESVIEIGEGAFYGLNITSIDIKGAVKAIPDYAFENSSLESFTFGGDIESIGAYAFSGCTNLTSISFNDSASVASITIGDFAFAVTGLTNVTLPDKAKTMGNYVFAYSADLEEVELPSVESLGAYTFEGCLSLQSVTYGDNATASGDYTFFPGISRTYFDSNNNMVVEYYASKLSSVDLGGLKALGEAVFWQCNSLTEINLKNVTVVGVGAFSDCTSLAEVENLDKVTRILDGAFENTALTSLVLTSVQTVGMQAFAGVAATALEIPAVKEIGYQAFAGIAIEKLNIPASLEKYGDGAFIAASKLSEITVDSNNATFKVFDNVLYRVITDSMTVNDNPYMKTGLDTMYELCLYPAARRGSANASSYSESIRNSYKVVDGTVAIQSLAFAQLNSGTLEAVILPYSLKTIGVSAFAGSYSIVRYDFETVNAPTLLSEYFDMGYKGFYSLFYDNFSTQSGFINYINNTYIFGSGSSENSNLSLYAPSNGVGYDNYVYNRYFGIYIHNVEVEDDDTRTLIAIIDELPTAEEVSAMMNWPVNDDNTKIVQNLSDAVKEAHRIYNTITSDVQMQFLTQERVDRLFAVENALKPVKARFGIISTVDNLRLDESSTHRTEYSEGETFDMTGLVLLVTYDDYSTELLSDTSKITLMTSRALSTIDTYVEVEYGGRFLLIPVTVTVGNEEDGGSNCAGLGAVGIGLIIGGSVFFVLACVGIVLICHVIYTKKAKSTDETTTESESNKQED